MKKYLIICFVLSYCLCFCNSNKQSLPIFGEGVIANLTKQGNFSFDNNIIIYNNDYTTYAKICRNKKGEITVLGVKNISIRAFFPDYEIIIFDAVKKENNVYKVYINGLWKLIKIQDGFQFYNWNDFIMHSYIELKKQTPLKKEPKNDSKTISNFDKYSYEVMEVKGEWVKLKCFYDCEGCPETGEKIIGWVKWRDKNKILVKLFYIC
jgi:hypothetical protein